MARISVPTSGRLSSNLRIDASSPVAQRIINRVSRHGLISLALEWLDEDNRPLCPPILAHYHDTNDFQPLAESAKELQRLYADMRERKGSKRDVLERILDGDWRDGLSLYQLATADMRYLHEHPASQKWAAYRIVPLSNNVADDQDEEPSLAVDRGSLNIPRFHPSTFLQNLQSQVLPDMKVHYHIDRPRGLALLIVRVFLVDTPYTTNVGLETASSEDSAQPDSSRTLFIAFPDASPFVYLSKPQSLGTTGGVEAKAFRALVAEGIPRALSQPRRRYRLKYVDMSTKNLDALLHTKGNSRAMAAGGGWGIYAHKKKAESPLDTGLPKPPASEGDESVPLAGGISTGQTARGRELGDAFSQRRKLVAHGRFGHSGKLDDGKGVERFDIKMEDSFAGPATEETDDPDEANWTPGLKLTFRGSHVFAGIRQLTELGAIDGRRMPGWLTGEEGVTTGAVRNGRIRGAKGASS
ncbi:centromere protein Chl4/mis15/CENP-N [Plectosphaerella plurivora]|uniref:Centromere protein Chl4/mis15/CENP-N n=1 Tax=Plectosphaerella plurivora TaxID=936078 RepID=A0A9P8V578_9PEZI|nr:centromere protein Chl4/mis15/CENP-N [Plectosphaerella plurivora]